MAVGVAIVQGDAAAAVDVHGIGGHERELVVAGERAREAHPGLAREIREPGRHDVAAPGAPHERARVLAHHGAHEALGGIRRDESRQCRHEEEDDHERAGKRGDRRGEPRQARRSCRRGPQNRPTQMRGRGTAGQLRGEPAAELFVREIVVASSHFVS